MSSQQYIHIAGWSQCGFYRKASGILTSLSILFPHNIKLISHEFPTRSEYRDWLIDGNFREKFSDVKARSHSSSPFVWKGNSDDMNDIKNLIGGCDDTIDWSRSYCSPDKSKEEAVMVEDGHKEDHGYDYDLIVIGGGSGGMAASKVASRLGAKVALLDYVVSSPQGTKWGLGGTCVNVGCIPKKLMHYGSLLNEASTHDSKAFGLTLPPAGFDWPTLRENVQNHIRGINFKSRVELREKKVTYLNRLAKFVDEHTLELQDKKGNKSNVTASRFIIAVGGRPTPLNCPGSELAISSDDVFALEKSPGKTLCVGASYISLECGGFLAGLGHDVTIAVRSILLRGFDQECAQKVGDYMQDANINIKWKVTPTELRKVDDKIQVTFSDGSVDTYDTVLAAIGRTGSTSQLGLEHVGIVTDESGKIPAKFEQTVTPNIYVIGDVMQNCPELTPVAIQAGQILARRLFADSKEAMDYKNVCTTVFTPIEYACVGYSEDEAAETFGKDNIVVYHKEFVPLEWTLARSKTGYAKVIVRNQDVIGIHYLGPNAGEVMQGYGVAMKQGLRFQSLLDTIGIHPTTSEELVTLSIVKGSGVDASAGNC